MKKQEQNSYAICYTIKCMDFEEREKQRRRQVAKVVIAELGMVCSVIAIVVVATLAAMGFFVSSKGTIEQSGLIQIHSMPTGATVELDGSVIFSRTNLSRTLSPGEHSLKLSRDGYDTWEKKVQMYSGVLARLYYPRLFLKNRTAEVALNIDAAAEFYSPSLDRNYILYAEQDSPVWHLINLHNNPEVTLLDLTEILPGVKEKKFAGKIDELKWNENGDRVLVRVSYEDKSEWILVNLRSLETSLNLTRTFGLEFTRVEMADDSASQLFGLENGHLRRINTANQAISRVLLDNVMDFANSKANLIYTKKVEQANQIQKVVGVYRDDERGGTDLATVDNDKAVLIAMTHYYDDDYLAYMIDNQLSIYYGTLPSYREQSEETDFSGLKTLFDGVTLMGVPDKLTLSPQGEYIVAQKDSQLSVIDLELGELTEYQAPTADFAWLDNDMMTTVAEQTLLVWDFDNQNRRELVKYDDKKAEKADAELSEVTTRSSAPLTANAVFVADNNRWLYYLVSSHDGLTLMRERIRD